MRDRLTYANVVATLGLFIALGGSAWAISANSVGSRQIKRGAVRNSDLADNAVTSGKVANGSLLSEDFAANQLAAGPKGDAGPPGPAGGSGPPGPPGKNAATLFAYVRAGEPGDQAVLQYGSGAVSVDDPPGVNPIFTGYVVHFDRDLTGCVATATPGTGQPGNGGEAGGLTSTIVHVYSNSVEVQFVTPIDSNADTNWDTIRGYDTAFMLVVFC